MNTPYRPPGRLIPYKEDYGDFVYLGLDAQEAVRQQEIEENMHDVNKYMFNEFPKGHFAFNKSRFSRKNRQ